MEDVRLSLQTYDSLKSSINIKSLRIDALEKEIEKLKFDHEAEIERLAQAGKVRVIEKPYSVMEMLLSHRNPSVEYKGFDDVKSEVEESFKQGLFNEEFEKHNADALERLHKRIIDQEDKICSLQSEIEHLKERSIWERVLNKY